MIAKHRREQILQRLSKEENPISATALGKEFSASRQLVVGDIALLRASGNDIIATPRGYLLKKDSNHHYTLACKHGEKDLEDEILTILECGCGLLNVIVEHGVYGQIVGNLHIFTKNDAENFIKNLEESKGKPLSELSDDVHNHTLFCPTEEHFVRVKAKLSEKGYLFE